MEIIYKRRERIGGDRENEGREKQRKRQNSGRKRMHGEQKWKKKRKSEKMERDIGIEKGEKIEGET